MGDILDIPRTLFTSDSSKELVSEFLDFRDPNHMMDAHARRLLESLAKHEEECCKLTFDHASGMLGFATLEQLGYRPGVPIREAVVVDGLARIGAKRCLFSLALHLWVAPRGTEPVGLVYTAPIPDGNGNSFYLVVRETQGIRWLYAQRMEAQRIWPPERKLIFSLL